MTPLDTYTDSTLRHLLVSRVLSHPWWYLRALLAGAVLLGVAGAASAAPATSTSDGVIVELAPDATAADRRAVAQRLDAHAVRSLGGQGLYLFERDATITRGVASRTVSGVDAVEGVSLDLPVATAEVPNDPCFIWNGACPIDYGAQADMSLINLPAARERLTSRTPVTVAVIDTSVGLDHPDLQGRLWSNPAESANGLDDDGNGFVDDLHGADWVDRDGDPNDTTGRGQHGTHVSGTIAAVAGNGIGIAGIAPGARIMSLRFLADTSGGQTSDAILAINYARAKGVQVINNSWVGWSTVRGYHGVCTAIRAALNDGVVVVSAAGNDGLDAEGGKLFGSTRYWPIPATCYDSDADGAAPATRAANGNGQLTVAATDNSDAMASFSNWGSEGSVDLAAPGYQVLSTVTNLSSLGARQNSYSWMSGTSMAAPHVAGAAALLWGERPALSAAAVRAAIITGGAAAPATDGKTASGRRLDLTGMLTQGGVGATDTAPPVMGDLQAPADGAITGSTGVGMYWAAAQDASPVTYDVYLNGTRLATNIATSPLSATLPEGRHTWYVVARDSSGNSATSASRTITVDLTSPSAPGALTPSDGSAAEAAPPTLAWSAATDALSGVAGYDVILDGATVQSVDAATTAIATPPLARGGHTWSVVARDRAGNTRTAGPWLFTVTSSQVIAPPTSPGPTPSPAPGPTPGPSPGPTPTSGVGNGGPGPSTSGGSLPITGLPSVGVSINGDGRATRSRAVQVAIAAPAGAVRMRVAESIERLAGADWIPLAPATVVIFAGPRTGESARRVHVQVADAAGAVIAEGTDEIVLDARAPRGTVRRLADGRWRIRALDASGGARFQVRNGTWRAVGARGVVITPPYGADAVRFRDALGNTGRWLSPR